MAAKLLMLVEDNPDDELLVLRALRKSSFCPNVVVARDGVEALEYLLADRPVEEQPTVIFLDLKLPRVNGLEVLQRLRNNTRTRPLPVVILTSSLEEQDIMECYKLGANSFIHKPVNYEQFNNVVNQVGHYWMQLNEPSLLTAI